MMKLLTVQLLPPSRVRDGVNENSEAEKRENIKTTIINSNIVFR
jgi:hypothetical protein